MKKLPCFSRCRHAPGHPPVEPADPAASVALITKALPMYLGLLGVAEIVLSMSFLHGKRSVKAPPIGRKQDGVGWRAPSRECSWCLLCG